jgi:hypothetical protein
MREGAARLRALLGDPRHVPRDALVGQQRLARVELARERFLVRNEAVDAAVALFADVQLSVAHLVEVEALPELPFAVDGARDEVVLGERHAGASA